jgi:REP element-mobilizing transposase RayT
MPRAARLDAPGVVHHIIVRGIERREIFRDDQDREGFLARLEMLLPVTQVTCYAWAFLPNHAHFLFRSGAIPIATLMRRLLTGYAVRFNHRHNRRGYLFQNRYKSILCQEDRYFQEVVRYIHLNPLRVGLVRTLGELNHFPYCGHSAVTGKKPRPWQDVRYVLHGFGRTAAKGRRAYLAFMAEGTTQGRREELVGGGLVRSMGGWEEVRKLRLGAQSHQKSDERILGDSEFVEEILAAAEERLTRRTAGRRHRNALERIAERAAEVYEMSAEEILRPSRQRQRVQARGLFCFWAVQELGVSLTELARRLRISVPAISYAVRRGELIAKTEGFELAEAET